MAKKELTQAQRDQKNERLRLARAASKNPALKLAAKTMPKAPHPNKGKKVPAALPPTSVSPTTPVHLRKVGSGGARPNTGFQKLPVDQKMVIISFRGYPAQKKKFAQLGGGEWCRARIDAGTVKAKA